MYYDDLNSLYSSVNNISMTDRRMRWANM